MRTADGKVYVMQSYVNVVDKSPTCRRGGFHHSNATIRADWTASASERWTVPVGGRFGKIFNVGKQSMSFSIQATANVVRPNGGPAWAGLGQISFLLP